MKKLILCLQCAEHWKKTAERTREPHKQVEGTAIDDFKCDGCNCDIVHGSKCIAFTVAPIGRSVYGQCWEADYIIFERKTKKMPSFQFEQTTA